MFGLHECGRQGCGLQHLPTGLVPHLPNYLSHPKEAGTHVRGQAYIRSKQLGKNDVTHEEVCLHVYGIEMPMIILFL